MISNKLSRMDLFDALHTSIPEIEGKKIFIWGTGNTALLYQEGLKRLERENFVITGYGDNDVKKLSGERRFCGKPIVSIEELAEEEDVHVLICTPQPKTIKAISRQMDEIGIPNTHIDEVIFKLHADELMECYDLLEDVESKDIYAQLMLCRMNGEYPKGIEVNKNQYFALDQFYNQNAAEVFVDCGAFVGDVVERYIWNKGGVFGKIIAFEPDRDNYNALFNRTERLKREWNLGNGAIELKLAGVDELTGGGGVFVQDETNGGLSSKFVETASKGDACLVCSIDETIKESFDFLKADIESYEYRMLIGAKESIEKYKPLLAICIYHNAVDFYSIMLLIKSIEPNYKFSVRHHTSLVSETVLYAWYEE